MRKKSAIFVVILLCFTGIAVYSNTFSSPFHFDDYFSIVANPAIRVLSNLKGIWDFWPQRFIAYYSLALNYRLGTLDVSGYHVFNILIHIISGIFVCWLALMIFSALGFKSYNNKRAAKALSLFCGLIFISHPVQTQAVTYIIQRTTSLAALFYFAALSFYVRARTLQNKKNNLILRKAFYFSSLAAAAAAMFTKETAITLPFTIILYEFCFLRKSRRINWKPLAPFLATLLIIPLIMLATGSVNFLEMHRVMEPASKISALHYLMTEFRVIITYLRLVLFPLNQNLDYDYPISGSFMQIDTLASLLFLAALFFLAVRLFRKYTLFSFGIFWFFLTLAPESSIIPIRDVIFEHRLYLPMFGYCLFVTGAFFYLWDRKKMLPMIAVLIILTLTYAVMAYRRNLVWKDGLTLWNDAILKSPKKSRPYSERGFVYLFSQDYDRAIFDFSYALLINPKNTGYYNSRGVAYIQKRDYHKAILDFTSAIGIDVRFAPAYTNRAIAFFYCGEYEKSWEDVNKAASQGVSCDPKFLETLSRVTRRQK